MRIFALTFFTSISLAGALMVDGLIVRVERGRVIVAHRPIPGYMPAMVMPFEMNNSESLHPGMRVQFEIERGSAKARKVRIIGEDLEDVPKPPPTLKAGDHLPGVDLVDQDNRPYRFQPGKPLAINFIYTRCPLPNVCPRQAAAFAALSRRYGDKVRFLSITLDPEFDTPARLAEYARKWNAGSWRFATGSAEQVRRIAQALGVIYWPEEGVLAHSSVTVIINREGRLSALVEGASHRLDQIASLIDAELEAR